MSRLRISAENAEFQIIRALQSNRAKRGKLHEIFIEGVGMVKQALGAELEITRIITADIPRLSGWGKGVITRCEGRGAKIIEMSPDLYRALASKENPSELMATAKVRETALEALTAENPCILLCDRPSGQGNFGSIVRSANAFQADGIFILGHGIDIYEPKVIRASLGSVFFTKIVNIPSMEMLARYIQEQKAKNGLRVIGTDSTGAVALQDAALQRPALFIIGNEAKGMSVKLKALCDEIIRIPVAGNVNSLNVSCAAAIVLWELSKGRPREPPTAPKESQTPR